MCFFYRKKDIIGKNSRKSISQNEITVGNMISLMQQDPNRFPNEVEIVPKQINMAKEGEKRQRIGLEHIHFLWFFTRSI